ncbi:Cytochrome, putative [Shewanella piezotolerans WP3]|uniref:Cytochrome, putative n=1 Tax=Shewanella piezotolerans (strain WP3 / JCM 13877) TaxID=225849 RepID=B8CT32_SHEPW|nr:cytochrome c [Shewanella piezotolerans]ACJ30808.1 Cytochrome, putative [Shewanella piezotolerans WP3]
MNRIMLLAVLLIFVTDVNADYEPSFEIGKQKAKVCMTCHGEDGISTLDPYPNLRGQKVGYLISSLKDYKSRQRTSGLAILMQQQADALSEQDIKDIAYYFSVLGTKKEGE